MQVHKVRTIQDIGEIPTGLPPPTLPPLNLLGQVLMPAGVVILQFEGRNLLCTITTRIVFPPFCSILRASIEKRPHLPL